MNTRHDIEAYIDKINKEYNTGRTTEHSFRVALKELMENIANEGVRNQHQKVFIINEPKRESYGAPDFAFIRDQLTVSFLETKNIGDRDIRGQSEKKHKNSLTAIRKP